MKEELTEQQADAILTALDKAIQTGPWEESNFLRAIGNNLREIREKFVQQVGGYEAKLKHESHIAKQVARRADQQKVFISLYSAEGGTLQSWERILNNLPRQMISRPIYAEEEDIKNLIKAKENKVNEAYVIIYINQADIMVVPPDKALLDKFGKPLLSLKDRSLNLDNISRFVHLSFEYEYVKGRLIKINP